MVLNFGWKMSQNKTLYHGTFYNNLLSIKSEGLIPNKELVWDDWSEKGYLYFNENPERCLGWMKDAINELDLDVEYVVILKVELPLDKIVEDFSSFHGSDFKYKGIVPPQNISIYGEFDPILKGKEVTGFNKISSLKEITSALFKLSDRVDYLREWFVNSYLDIMKSQQPLYGRYPDTYRHDADMSFSQLLQIDPSSNKQYLQWLCQLDLNSLSRWNNLSYDIQEDGYKLTKYLKALQEMKLHKVPNIDYDINHYKTPQDLFQVVQPHLEEANTNYKNHELQTIKEEATLIFEDEHWKVIQPHTYKASCLLGRGTEWCTAYEESDHNWENYDQDGELIIFINKDNKRKYQMFLPREDDPNHPDHENFIEPYNNEPEFRDWADREMDRERTYSEGFYDDPKFAEFYWSLGVPSEFRIDKDELEELAKEEKEDEEFKKNNPDWHQQGLKAITSALNKLVPLSNIENKGQVSEETKQNIKRFFEDYYNKHQQEFKRFGFNSFSQFFSIFVKFYESYASYLNNGQDAYSLMLSEVKDFSNSEEIEAILNQFLEGGMNKFLDNRHLLGIKQALLKLADRVDFLREQFFNEIAKKELHTYHNPYGKSEDSEATFIELQKEQKKDNYTNQFNQLVTIDPTKNKQYLQWIIKMYLQDKVKWEDLEKIREDLTMFYDLNLRKKLPIEVRDINQYQDPAQLYETLKPFSDNSDLLRTHNQSERKSIETGAVKIWENPEWMLYVPNTHEASCALGKGSRWCTTGAESTFNSYTGENGTLFILLNKENPEEKYQFHFETGQFMDIEDNPVNISEAFENVPLQDTKSAKTAMLNYLRSIKSSTAGELGTVIALGGTKSLYEYWKTLKPDQKKEYIKKNELAFDKKGQAYFVVEDWSDDSIINLFKDGDRHFDYRESVKEMFEGQLNQPYYDQNVSLSNYGYDFYLIDKDNLNLIKNYLKSEGMKVTAEFTPENLREIMYEDTGELNELENAMENAFTRAQESADADEMYSSIIKEIENTLGSKYQWLEFEGQTYLAFPIFVSNWSNGITDPDGEGNVSTLGDIIKNSLEIDGNEISPYNLFNYGASGDIKDQKEYLNEKLSEELNDIYKPKVKEPKIKTKGEFLNITSALEILAGRVEFLQEKFVQEYTTAFFDFWFKDNYGGSSPMNTKQEDIINEKVSPTVIQGVKKEGAERAQDEFNQILSVDPTPNKQYLQWVISLLDIKELAKGTSSRFVEDIPKYRENLQFFYNLNLKKKLPLDERDINKFESFSDLFETIEPYIEEAELSGDRAQRILKEDAKKIWDGQQWEIWIPESEEASCLLGSGTDWCTAKEDNSYFNQYSRQSPLYICINKQNRKEKYQLHFATSQFMDKSDSSINLSELFDMSPELVKAFKPIGKEIMENYDLGSYIDKWIDDGIDYDRDYLDEDISDQDRFNSLAKDAITEIAQESGLNPETLFQDLKIAGFIDYSHNEIEDNTIYPEINPELEERVTRDMWHEIDLYKEKNDFKGFVESGYLNDKIYSSDGDMNRNYDDISSLIYESFSLQVIKAIKEKFEEWEENEVNNENLPEDVKMKIERYLYDKREEQGQLNMFSLKKALKKLLNM